jgi:hypothetical protein
MLNTHCFVGYFTNFMSIPYNVTITPCNTLGSTSMTDLDTSTTADTLLPLVMPNGRKSIMYSKPDYTTFTVDGMEILMCLFSFWKVTAASITPEMKTMMTAQKTF